MRRLNRHCLIVHQLQDTLVVCGTEVLETLRCLHLNERNVSLVAIGAVNLLSHAKALQQSDNLP